jgi:hypothetical protein
MDKRNLLLPFKPGSLQKIGKTLSERLRDEMKDEKKSPRVNHQKPELKHRGEFDPVIIARKEKPAPKNEKPVIKNEKNEKPIIKNDKNDKNEKPVVKNEKNDKNEKNEKPVIKNEKNEKNEKNQPEPKEPPKYVKKKYTNTEISEKLKGYLLVPKEDIAKVDIGDYIRFYKGTEFYSGGQIVYFGFNKEKNTAFWMYTCSLIPIDGKFPNRYTVYWKDITQLWKRAGRPYECEILQKKIIELQNRVNRITKFLLDKYGNEFKNYIKE